MTADEKKPPIRILNIEDEAHIQTVTKLALEFDGFLVENCGSGEEALKKAMTCAPDLILLDVMLPDTDGPTLLKALRRIPSLATTPIVFMKALVQAHDISRYKSIGAVDVIVKPFDPMGLPKQIRKIWESHHG